MIRRTWTVDDDLMVSTDQDGWIRFDNELAFTADMIDDVIEVLREIQRSAKDVNSDTPGASGSQPDEAAVAPSGSRTGKPRRGG